MILRKFIGWTILIGAFMLGYVAFPVSAETAVEKAPLTQSSVAPAQLRLQGWPPAGWTVQQIDELVEIKFPQMVRDVVLPRGLTGRLAHRVAALDYELRGDDLYLRLTLDCACSVAVTSEAANAVLIDVINQNGADPAEDASAPKTAPFPTVKPGSAVASSPAEFSTSQQLNVEEAQKRLMEQLLRAADAGMVDLRPDPSDLGSSEAEPDQLTADNSVPSAPQPDAVSDSTEPTESQNAAEATPAGVAKKAQAESVETEEASTTKRPEPSCFPDEAFAFQDSEIGEPFPLRASKIHASLVGEFDEIAEEAALKLARLNLAAGLGAEAVAILDELIPSHPWSELYREIAAVLGDQLPQSDASLWKEDCNGQQRLWRAAVNLLADDPILALKDAEASATDLERQPRFLREHMATRIGLAAADAGSWDFARRMEAMAKRSMSSSYGPSGHALILSARLDAWHERHDDAVQKLKDARALSGSVGEEALLQLAEAALTNSGLAATDTTLLQEDLAILAKADRGGAKGQSAFELWVKLQEHALGRDVALESLDQGVADGLLPIERRAGLIAEIVEGTDVKDAGKPLAMAYLENPGRFAAAMEKPGFRRAVVGSMIDVGVPSLAEEVMTQDDWVHPGMGLDLARAHLAQGNTDQAVQVLRRLPEEPARNQLIASALTSDGKIGEAKAYIDTASETEMASDQDLMALDVKLQSALQSGDIEAALVLGSQRMSHEPDDQLLEQLALAALDAGYSELPKNLDAFLSDDRRDDLQNLFRLNNDPADFADLTEMNNFIDQLSSEISAIEELLKDG